MMLTKQWLEKNGLLIGSRGLNINTIKADYDYVVLEKDFNNIQGDFQILDLRKYHNVIPPLGNNSVVLKVPVEDIIVDIIIFENKEHIDIIKRSLNDIKLVPKYLLEDKFTRVHLFESALIHYGMIRSNPYYDETYVPDEDSIPF